MKDHSETPIVLDIWSHIDPSYGGVAPAAALLSQAVQERSGWGAHQLAICGRTEVARGDTIPRTVRTVHLKAPRPFADFALIAPLRAAISQCDVCHVHGIWLAPSLLVGKLALQLHKPLVSSVHGMLQGWESGNKRLKKAFYSSLFEKRSLSRSACLRALSTEEVGDYRRFGLRNPIAIVPNGIAPLERVNPSGFLERHPELRDKKVVLFLGRVHHKKGILNLLKAWPAVTRENPDAHLLIAGPECGNTGLLARQLISDGRTFTSVTFCGVLNGIPKMSALSLANVFCLPSYSEGLSIAVLESLSIGLPVVVTPACNVGGIVETGSGFVTSNSPADLARSISQCLSLPAQEWKMMADSARLLARSRYDWGAAAEAMQSVYTWLLGGLRPAFVVD